MWVILFTVGLPGDIISEADGCQGDKTEVQRLQKTPVLLQADKDTCRDDEEQKSHDEGQAGGMYGSQLWFRHGPAPVEVFHWTSSYQDHDPLHHDGEEKEGDWDAQEGVEDAESLPFV